MMMKDNLQTLIGLLAETPTLVRQFVGNLSESEMRWKPSAQEFSAVEHVCHLGDLEREGYAVRIEKLLHEEQPFLPDFDGGKIAAERDYNQQPLAAVLDAFTLSRENNLRAINGLSPDAFQRSGTLETVGTITLETLLRKMREHDEDHLQELSKLSAKLAHSVNETDR